MWSWRTSDYFGYDEVPYPIRWGPLEGYGGNEVDPFHLNSLQRVADGTGDYVVSARHMDSVFRVDRDTKATSTGSSAASRRPHRQVRCATPHDHR